MAHSVSLVSGADRIAQSEAPPAHGRLVPLDGLRGIAVFLVLLFHWKYLPFGWSGVWLFFTLSGFFIFRNLLATRQSRPDMKLGPFYGQFMVRRCLRLLPLYYLLLLVMVVVVTILQRWDLLGYTVPGLALFIHNLVKPFSTIQHTLYYDHFWSLGVEMHFYLVAPLLVFFLSRRALQVLLVAIVLVSPILRQTALEILSADPGALTIRPGGFIYFFSLFHFDAFALGGLAAMHERDLVRLGQKTWWLLLVPGTLFIAYFLGVGLLFRDVPYQLFMADHLQASLGYTLLILGCTGLICVGLVDHGLLHRFLTLPPLLLLGRISYGVYLIHGAILMLTFQIWDSYFPGLGRFSPQILAVFCVYLLVTVGLAWLSFTYFESRFLARPKLISARAMGGG
ncbi:acyltransferase family protein [Geminicoccus roseus]|uniref:acyltransferase family protein n=1 Tax=Geminicoccus roseus TaxID=404900 RepID=UPI000407F8ED|nr:acyltransferase [Geminicoccus roseus]